MMMLEKEARKSGEDLTGETKTIASEHETKTAAYIPRYFTGWTMV